MSADGVESHEIRSLRLFPWVRLLRGVGLALDARKLVLAVLGLLLMAAGWYAIAALLDPEAIQPSRLPSIPAPFDLPVGWETLGDAAARVTDPIRWIGLPFARILRIGAGPTRFLAGLFLLFWGLLVWGVLGGAIVRIAAVQSASGGRVGIGGSLQYATSRFVPLVSAPLVVVGGIAFLAALCALVGLLYRAPQWGGEIVAGAMAGLPLLLGSVMTWLLVGLAAGWPLMVATVAIEGEDTFDALSRSFSYVFQRPVWFAFYAALAWALGTVGLVFVSLLARLIVHLAAWGLAFGAPDDRVRQLFEPRLVERSPEAALHAGWVHLVWLLVLGWIFSYFWSAAAQIYLLLRHDVDGTPWDDIDLPGHEAEPFPPLEDPVPEKVDPSA
jgi:hypothetical protein